MGAHGTGADAPSAGGFRIIAGQVDQRALPALLTAFSAGAEDRLARLNEAATGGQREAFLQVLHALRGSAGSYGADSLADACARLEVRARSGDPLDALASAITELTTEVAEAVGSMRSVLVELGIR